MSKILCIGEVNLDVVAIISSDINYGSDTAAKVSTHGGGAGGNVAAWLRIAGAQSHMLARIGKDAAGVAVRSEFDRLGVTYSEIDVHGAPTGIVVVIVDKDGERSMFPDNGANSGLTLADLPELDSFNAAYISGYALLDPKSRPGILQMIGKIKAAGLKIYLDPATVGGMAGVPIAEIRAWINQVHCLLLSDHTLTESPGIFGRQLLRNLIGLGQEVAGVTRPLWTLGGERRGRDLGYPGSRRRPARYEPEDER